MDVGQAYVKSSNEGNAAGQAGVGRLDSNSSYLGFKGVEDLGNGLKAVFQYETGFAADTAGALAGGRDTYLGLTGGFGTALAGNLTHPLRAMMAKTELMPGAAGIGTMASLTGTVLGVQTGADNRAANALAYVSPSFSGFSATVAYVNGERKDQNTAAAGAADNSRNTKAWQIAGQYENGPLFAAIGYHSAKDTGTALTLNQGTGAITAITIGSNSNVDTSILRLAGAYTLPTKTKLTALYDRTKSDVAITLINPAAAGATGEVKRNAWYVGAAQEFGATTLGVEYGRSSDVSVSNTKLDQTDANIWSLLATHSLSKRTSVHARFSKLSNGDLNATSFYNNSVGANAAAVSPLAGATVTGYMVGLRHAF